MLHLLQICVCFVMRVTSCCLFLATIFNEDNVIESFYSTSSYLDYLFNIDNHYSKQMVGQIYPTKNCS